MGNYVVHEENYKRLTIKIIQDDYDDVDPILDWDMMGKQVYWHRRMNLGHCYKETTRYSHEEWFRKEVGDKLLVNNWDVYSKKYKNFENWELGKLQEEFEKYNLVIPVHAYEHGGITISANGKHAGWDSFDSRQLGFVYVSHDDILKRFGKKKLNKKMLETTKEILIQEVSAYDDYLNGNVWGYIILNSVGEELDNCWGFLGDWRCCLETAKAEADWCVIEREKSGDELDRRMVGK